MAGQARPSSLHFLVFVLCISSRCFQVHGLQDFLGSCGMTIDLMMNVQSVNVQSGILRMPMPESMDKFQDPTKPINCDVTVTFTSGMNLLVELYFLDIMPLSGDVKSCSTGLEIFDQTNRKYYGSRLCMEGWQWEERHRQKNQEKVVVQNSPLIFRLVSGGPYRGEGFKVHFNQMRPTWPCYMREFRCREIQRCVHDDLTCDGWDDCGDYSDERMEAGCKLLTASEICALIMGVILLLGAAGMVIVFIIIYRRMSMTYGVKSESKVPIADDKYSMDSIRLGGRYNSQDSLPSKYSRSTAHNRRDSDSDTIDKVDLEKAERMSNKTGDNMSERSYRSNPRKNLLHNLGNEVQPDPVKKSGQYSYGGRKSRTSSQSSLNRDKTEPTNGNADTANQDGREKDRLGSKDRLSEKGRDRNSLDRKSDRNRDRYSDSDDYSDDRDRYDDRRRRRSRERDRRRDDEYSDDDSDYDRDRRRRRRRSYDRYSDDSDYEYERERDRRRSRERRSRSRHDDDDSSESDRNKAPDDKKDIDKPRRGGSRDRDRDRGRRSRGRYDDDDDSDRDRYQDLQDEKDSGRNPRRSSRERDRDRYRDSYDEDRDRRRSRHDDDDYRPSERKRSRERRRGPSSERDKLKDAPSRSRENIGAQERDDKSPALPLPPPYSEEDPNNKPLRDAIPPAGNKRYPEQKNQQAAPQNPSQYTEPQRTPKPPPSSEDIRRAEQQHQKPPPPSDTKYREPQMPKPSGPDTRQGQSQKQLPKEVDETDRRRSTDNRRERYSRNRWTPKQKSEDLPPPDYEDVTPKSAYVGITYKEESV